MKDERITLKTAKLLREKNFDIGVNGLYTEYLYTQKDSEYPEGGGPFSMKKGEAEYDSSYFKNHNPYCDYSGKYYIMCAAPSQSIVARWLREVHNIQVYAVSSTTNGKTYRDYVGHVCPAPIENNFSVVKTAINDPRDEEFQTYEAALEATLQIALGMI